MKESVLIGCVVLIAHSPTGIRYMAIGSFYETFPKRSFLMTFLFLLRYGTLSDVLSFV